MPRVGFHFHFPGLLKCRCLPGKTELLNSAQEDHATAEKSVSSWNCRGGIRIGRV